MLYRQKKSRPKAVDDGVYGEESMDIAPIEQSNQGVVHKVLLF
jgi:hypothetical protein